MILNEFYEIWTVMDLGTNSDSAYLLTTLFDGIVTVTVRVFRQVVMGVKMFRSKTVHISSSIWASTTR